MWGFPRYDPLLMTMSFHVNSFTEITRIGLWLGIFFCGSDGLQLLLVVRHQKTEMVLAVPQVKRHEVFRTVGLKFLDGRR